jgi:hypothetical protein
VLFGHDKDTGVAKWISFENKMTIVIPRNKFKNIKNKKTNYVPVCFGFSQLLATKSCCGLPNTQLFSQLL